MFEPERDVRGGGPFSDAQSDTRPSCSGVSATGPEYPIGCTTGADAFEARDRIQAGLSIVVMPVQMGLAGGTQHTVRFAFAARRRVLYPRLSEAERSVPENEGIVALMEDGRAIPFDEEDIPRLLSELPELLAELLRVSSEPRPVEPGNSW